MMYKILPYTYRKAQKLGVIVKPSIRSGKKIDVYNKRGEFICSIGAMGYKDYPTYLKTKGKQYADQRRKLYKLRHSTDRMVKGSPGFYADQLLW